MPYDILIVAEQKFLRDAIGIIVESANEFRIAAVAENRTEAVEVCNECNPDVALIEFGTIGLNGLGVAGILLRQRPRLSVVFFSKHDDDGSVLSAIRAGARAYLSRRASAGDLLDALRAVCNGRSYFGPILAEGVLARIQEGGVEAKALRLEGLSPRELEVLRLIALGGTSKSIAGRLRLGVSDVRRDRQILMKKLCTNSVAGLTQAAVSAGLTDEHSVSAVLRADARV
jgi:two-component system nitrate/nitrite response regulator NarL